MLWLGVASTWYLTPIIQLTGLDVFMVPVSVAEKIGLGAAIGTALLGQAV